MKKIVILFLLSLSLFACTTSRVVKPLNKGELNISADLGGPAVSYHGYLLPVPLSSISTSYGLSQNTSLYGGIHTSALIFGVAQFDVGATREITKANAYQPGLSVSPSINMSMDVWEYNYHVNPAIDVNLYWDVENSNNYYYVGLANWFELNRKRDHDEDQPHAWVPALQGGYTWIRRNLRLTGEAKYLAPFSSNEGLTVNYLGPFGRGALGVYFSVGYRIR